MSEETEGTEAAIPEGETAPDSALATAATLEDALGAAWDEMTEAEEAKAGGKSTPDEEQAEAAEKPEEPEEAPASAVAAPAHWSAETKAKFDSLPEEAKAVALDMAKSQEADYTRKTQELAEKSRQIEPLMGIVGTDEAKAYFESVDVTAEQAVRTLLQTEYALRNGTPDQKAAIISSLIEHYGVAPTGGQQPANPENQQLRAQIRQLESRLAGFEQQTQNSRQQDILSQIEAFQTAKDGEGNLLHPHFQDVEAEMAQLITADRSMTLEAAYNKAIRINDAVFAKVEAEREQARKAAKAKAAEEAKKKASPKSRTSMPTGQKPKSVEDAVHAAWAEAAGA